MHHKPKYAVRVFYSISQKKSKCGSLCNIYVAPTPLKKGVSVSMSVTLCITFNLLFFQIITGVDVSLLACLMSVSVSVLHIIYKIGWIFV